MNTPARCGTPSGYRRHQLHGEKPCDACARAKREYDQRYRSAPEKVRQSRLHANAQAKAATRLRRMYPDDWARLYAEEKSRLSQEGA